MRAREGITAASEEYCDLRPHLGWSFLAKIFPCSATDPSIFDPAATIHSSSK
jgi:hypothetical protein